MDEFNSIEIVAQKIKDNLEYSNNKKSISILLSDTPIKATILPAFIYTYTSTSLKYSGSFERIDS